MPANKRPRKLNYAVNQKGKITWSKVGNAIKAYKKLKTREDFEWKTKWLEKAFEFSKAKLKKYWINPNKI